MARRRIHTAETLHANNIILISHDDLSARTIVRKNRRMRTMTHYLIVNMAVADLLITIFHMPYKLQIQLTNRHAVMIRGPVCLSICKLAGYTQDVSIACSVLSLMSIAMDRFMAIVFPFKRITLLQRTRYVIMSL